MVLGTDVIFAIVSGQFSLEEIVLCVGREEKSKRRREKKIASVECKGVSTQSW